MLKYFFSFNNEKIKWGGEPELYWRWVGRQVFITTPRLIYRDQELLQLLNVIEDDYQFLGVHVRFGSLLGCLQIIFL